MKKIITFLLLIVIPCIILADAAAPEIDPYVGVIENKSGAYFYEFDSDKETYVRSDRKLEYGEKVIVIDHVDNYAILYNYVDVLLIGDIKKTDESYEEYEKELSKVKEIETEEIEEKVENNTHKTLYICIISAIIVCVIAIVILLCVNKRKEMV